MATKTFIALCETGNRKVRGATVVEGTPFVVHRELIAEGMGPLWDFSHAWNGHRAGGNCESRAEAVELAAALWRLASPAFRKWLGNTTPPEPPKLPVSDMLLLAALDLTEISDVTRRRVLALDEFPVFGA